MAKEKQIQQERVVLVTIRPPKGKPVIFESWQYNGILNALRQEYATMNEAYDTAKWCARKAKPGDRKTLWPGIEVEVTAG